MDKMNQDESRAWDTLRELGATELMFGSKPALDLSTIRPRASEITKLIDAVIRVKGNSKTVRRHVNRKGQLVFVVTDSKP